MSCSPQGALTDLTNTNDDIQAQLDKASVPSDIDAQLAALKAPARRPNCRRARATPPPKRPRPKETSRGEIKIETDHRLNVRMFITGLALVALYAIIISVMLSFGCLARARDHHRAAR